VIRKALLLFLAACLCSLSAGSQTSPSHQDSFTIAGVLVEHGTNQPIKRAHVLLIPVENRERQLACTTSDDGRFAFTGLAAGKYSLEAQTRNAAQALEQNEEYATAIAVGPNLDSEHVVFALARGARITGSVVDEEGEGVRNAQVFLFHKGVFSGRSQIVMQTQVMTDSAGAFRFARLASGTYFVAVSARPWYAQNVPAQNSSSGPGSPDLEENKSRAELDVAYPLTYYADAIDPAAASPITLSEGDRVEVSMNLRPVPALHLDLPGDATSQNQNMSFGVFALGPGGVPIPTNAIQSFDSNGRQFMGLAPGRYLLSAQQFEQGSISVARTKILELNSNSTLDFGEASQTSISGQIQVDGSDLSQGLAVTLTHVNSGQTIAGFTAQDGSFRISDVGIRSGRYEIRLANTTQLYIHSISVKGAAYSNGILEISDGATVRISIVARKGLARVNGVAMKDGKPFAGAMVLLLPRDGSHGLYIPRDQSDSDGTFTLNFAPPGRYALLAIDDGRDLAYRDASVVAPYLAEAQSIEVPLPGDPVVQVNVQRRRR